jgi:uncharacterized glyoxalase superfamily protein PhnB
MQWMRSNPVFPVRDVVASIEWYRRIFDFEAILANPPGDENPVYAVLTQGVVSIHLLRRDEAPHGLTSPVQAQFWIDGDLDQLFDRVSLMDVRILQRPGNQPWGHRDFMVADPDENVVWVTAPLRAG